MPFVRYISPPDFRIIMGDVPHVMWSRARRSWTSFHKLWFQSNSLERITWRVVNPVGNKRNSIITDLVGFLLHPPVPTLHISNKNQIAIFDVILYYNLWKVHWKARRYIHISFMYNIVSFFFIPLNLFAGNFRESSRDTQNWALNRWLWLESSTQTN